MTLKFFVYILRKKELIKMAKLSVSISINPETEKERESQDSYQNINYNLGGFKIGLKLDELNDMIYDWIKAQKK